MIIKYLPHLINYHVQNVATRGVSPQSHEDTKIFLICQFYFVFFVTLWLISVMTTGYSGTPLAKKLGIKENFVVLGVNPPDDFQEMLAPLLENVTIVAVPQQGIDLIHLFTNSRDELFGKLAECVRLIKQNGSIWVSWYKKAAKLPTEITEDTVREAAFPLGLVDIKVCAVDEKWSGLKLVIRKENRI